MPWFRFTGDVKFEIPFRNGRCELTFSVLTGDQAWAWVARKVDGATSPAEVILCRRGNMLGLRHSLTFDGFPVDAGTAAEKIMLAACRLDRAEKMPDDPAERAALRQSRIQAAQAEARAANARATRGRHTSFSP